MYGIANFSIGISARTQVNEIALQTIVNYTTTTCNMNTLLKSDLIIIILSLCGFFGRFSRTGSEYLVNERKKLVDTAGFGNQFGCPH
jgi:hypothetical protein